jgi:nitrite reductase (NO-forming)
VALYALPTDQKVGLAVVGALFVLFALSSSVLIPRFRPQYPARALPAFIIVSFVFFFAMLTAVEVFGAEPKESEPGARTEAAQAPPTTTSATVSTAATTATQQTTPAAKTTSQTVQVTEKEFKITLAPASLRAGPVRFQIKNTGKIAHDLAIVGGPKSKLIQPGGTATLKALLKAGPIELYCSVPGHKQAGMDVKTTVSAGAAAAPPATTTTAKPAAKPLTIQVTEKEFKITLAASLHAGPVTFQIKNTGKLPHDLAVVGGPKSTLIQPGGTATLKATLKAGPIELYCTVPGHKQAGMDVKQTVS